MITAVITCPRPPGGETYLQQTVDSLFAAGATDVYYYDDVCRIGSGPATIELLKELHSRFPGEDVLLLEDDVIACRNAVHAAKAVGFPVNCDVLTLYVNENAKLSFHNFKVLPLPARDGFAYGQALKLSGNLVRYIATTPFDPPPIQPRDWWEVRDNTLWHYFREHGGFIGYVGPSWFQHIGEVSAIFGNRKYMPRARDWKGVEHDALTDDLSSVLFV